MKMRATAFLLACAAVVCLAAGCGQSSSAKAAATDPKSLAGQIKSSVKFTDQLTEVNAKSAEKRYGVDAAQVADCDAFVGTGATAEELSVWKAKDETAAQEIKTKAEKFVGIQKSSYADYKPAEVPKITSAVLQQKGKLVVMCISADNQKAKTVVSGLLG